MLQDNTVSSTSDFEIVRSVEQILRETEAHGSDNEADALYADETMSNSTVDVPLFPSDDDDSNDSYDYYLWHNQRNPRYHDPDYNPRDFYD